MSYWFALLVLFILIKTVQNAYLEYKAEREARVGLDRPRTIAYVEITSPEGDELGKRFPLRRENILGSGAGCDICLPYRSVSGEHASIFQKNHRAFVAVLAARKGVFVNDEKITKARELAQNDRIRLGKIELIYKAVKEERDD